MPTRFTMTRWVKPQEWKRLERWQREHWPYLREVGIRGGDRISLVPYVWLQHWILVEQPFTGRYRDAEEFLLGHSQAEANAMDAAWQRFCQSERGLDYSLIAWLQDQNAQTFCAFSGAERVWVEGEEVTQDPRPLRVCLQERSVLSTKDLVGEIWDGVHVYLYGQPVDPRWDAAIFIPYLALRLRLASQEPRITDQALRRWIGQVVEELTSLGDEHPRLSRLDQSLAQSLAVQHHDAMVRRLASQFPEGGEADGPRMF